VVSIMGQAEAEAMNAAGSYRTVSDDGIHAAIMHNGKVLILKRLNLPVLMLRPGKWAFVSGRREKGETHLGTAYREIEEETGISRQHLKLLHSVKNTMIINHGRRKKWANAFFIFCSSSDKVRLNFEHTSYMWADVKTLESRSVLESFYEKGKVLVLIKRGMNECESNVGLH
jgi:8-oxo-dGTP pyrophosphatase MutT (NUDIX family)